MVSAILLCFFFFFKQKTAYEMRISDWSSDVCSSDLILTFGLAMTDFASLVPSQPGRFNGIQRSYTPADVERLRGSLAIEHTLARRGAERLWELDRKSVV